MAFSDERDYEEEESNRRDMEREGREELEAERMESASQPIVKSTDDFYTYNSRPDDYDDDPAGHEFDCHCIFCIPGF